MIPNTLKGFDFQLGSQRLGLRACGALAQAWPEEHLQRDRRAAKRRRDA